MFKRFQTLQPHNNYYKVFILKDWYSTVPNCMYTRLFFGKTSALLKALFETYFYNDGIYIL